MFRSFLFALTGFLKHSGVRLHLHYRMKYIGLQRRDRVVTHVGIKQVLTVGYRLRDEDKQKYCALTVVRYEYVDHHSLNRTVLTAGTCPSCKKKSEEINRRALQRSLFPASFFFALSV